MKIESSELKYSHQIVIDGVKMYIKKKKYVLPFLPMNGDVGAVVCECSRI